MSFQCRCHEPLAAEIQSRPVSRGAASKESILRPDSDRRKLNKGSRWPCNDYRVPRPDIAAGYDNSHDPRLAHDVAATVLFQHGAHQPFLQPVQLRAWVTQSRDSHDSFVSDVQHLAVTDRSR